MGARERYLRAGFDDYLTKPVNGAELEKMLRDYLPADKIEIHREVEEAENIGAAEKTKEAENTGAAEKTKEAGKTGETEKATEAGSEVKKAEPAADA